MLGEPQQMSTRDKLREQHPSLLGSQTGLTYLNPSFHSTVKEMLANTEGFIVTPTNEALIGAMCKDLAVRRWTLLKVGMMAGKSVLALQACRALHMTHVSIYAHTNTAAYDYGAPYRELGLKVQCNGQHDDHYGDTFVVIEDAFWMNNSFDLFNRLRKNINNRIVVLGSRGPSFDNDLRWRTLPGHSFATWDLHPTLTFDEVQKLGAEKDLKLFLRDYGAF